MGFLKVFWLVLAEIKYRVSTKEMIEDNRKVYWFKVITEIGHKFKFLDHYMYNKTELKEKDLTKKNFSLKFYMK